MSYGRISAQHASIRVRRMPLALLFICFNLPLLLAPASAENLIAYFPHTGMVETVTPNETHYRKGLYPDAVVKAGNVKLTIDYQDPPGQGFNDDREGAERR